MKTILAVWHSANKGKTETLREFALLLINYPGLREVFPIPKYVPATKDFRLVVEIKGKIIGIESQGDPNTRLQERLIDLVNTYNCDIILCTSRTKGDTVAAVDYLFENFGFQTIWTSTYQIADKSKQAIVNQLKAKHILELFQSLGLM